MKKSLVLLAALTVVGCGMSESEQNRIAEVACSALSATSEEDSLDRLQIINDARQELGEEVFTGSGEEIGRYLRYGTCADFVRNRDNVLSQTDQRNSAYRKMVEIADYKDLKGTKLFKFDIVTDEGFYFFWVSENEREEKGSKATNGDLALFSKSIDYVLDSESMEKVQNAVLRGKINLRGLKEDEFGRLVGNGKRYGGRVEATLVNGKLEGVFKTWNENGQITIESNFVNGIREGQTRGWHSNGQSWLSTNYVDGFATGVHKQWHNNGQIATEVTLLSNKKNSAQRHWSESGILTFEGRFADGLQVGKHFFWYEDGKKRSETEYENGVLHGTHIMWKKNGQELANWKYEKGKREGMQESYGGLRTCYKNGVEVEKSECY